MDGRESFCYGVDESWVPYKPGLRSTQFEQTYMNKLFVTMTPLEKRHQFFRTMNWSSFEALVSQAGCARGGGADTVECVMALLCLTSFHDIMKLEELLPTVQSEHSPYNGFEAGTVIHDHDVALAYVLEHFPQHLPSFQGLSAMGQKMVIFSQGKIHFNHGWFVQAEAPPGAMLSKFKTVLMSGASSKDIGFYFLHWFTDLAGAEATPLGGAEKFVLKFPHKALVAFLSSIPFLGRLADTSTTETEVVERYLKARWAELASSGQQVPDNEFAVAKMRLAIMAQSDLTVADAFDELPLKDQTVLATELSRTGCVGQYFSSRREEEGPAILVYYGPALVQMMSGSAEKLRNAATVLARIFQAAACFGSPAWIWWAER